MAVYGAIHGDLWWQYLENFIKFISGRDFEAGI